MSGFEFCEFIFCGFGVLLFGVFLGMDEDGMGWGVVIICVGSEVWGGLTERCGILMAWVGRGVVGDGGWGMGGWEMGDGVW